MDKIKIKYAEIHKGDCNYCIKDNQKTSRLGYCCDYGGDNDKFVCDFDTDEFKEFEKKETIVKANIVKCYFKEVNNANR